MSDQKMIRPLFSPWSSPVWMVPKHWTLPEKSGRVIVNVSVPIEFQETYSLLQ